MGNHLKKPGKRRMALKKKLAGRERRKLETKGKAPASPAGG